MLAAYSKGQQVQYRRVKVLCEAWLIEQSTWATNKRVEAVAAKQLGMRLPDPSNTVVVTLDARAPAGEAR